MSPDRRFRSYDDRRLPMLVGGLLVSALLFGGTILYVIEYQLMQTTGQTLALAAGAVADELDRIVLERQSDARMMARAFTGRCSDTPYLSTYLEWMSQAYPLYQSLSMIDVYGHVIMSTNTALAGKDFSEQPWFAQVRNHRGADVYQWESTTLSAQADDSGVFFATAITDSSGIFCGAVLSQVRLTALGAFTTNVRWASSAGTMPLPSLEYQFVTSSGRIFSDSSQETDATPANLRALAVPSFLRAESEQIGFLEETHIRRKVPVVTGFARTHGIQDSMNPEWTVLLRVDRSTLLNPIRVRVGFVGILGLMGIAPLTMGLVWIARRLQNVGQVAHLERARASTAEEAKRQMAAIVESADDAIIGKTLDGLVTSWNDGAERLFGYTAAEAVGRPITVLFPPDRLEEEPRTVERLKRGEHIKHFETVRLRKNGHPVEVSLTLSPIKGWQGTIVGASIIVRDITERKRTEKAMIEALAMLDATLDGAFIFDPQTLRFAYVNEGAVRQVGYSREELLRMTPLDLKPEFDEPRFRAMVAPLASGAELVHSFTTVHRRKDGVDVPVEINLQCVGAGTAQARLISIVRDITERKRAQEKFRRVVEGAPNAMILVNRKGIITLVNAQTETLFGYSREELLGQSIDILSPAPLRGAHPGHRAAFFADFKMRAMGADRDLYGLHKDGREIPIEINLNPIETAEGLMVLSSIMDITERKRAEEVLRESEERFRTLANNMSQLAWMADAQGWTFWYNRRWFDYSGTTLEDMEGWGWQKVHHPDHVQRVVDKIRHCFQAGEVWEDTFPLRGRDGNYRWFLSRAVPIHNEEGKVFRWFGTNTDVTEQRGVADALKDNREQLEASNKELEAFSYSVSHDLRAPLRSIDGFSQALLEDCADRLNDQGKDHLNRIRAASQRMGQLIDDLLSLSRATRDELRREPVNLSALALGSADWLRKIWPGRQVQLVVAPGLCAEGDPRLLRIVFENLLENAWKFTSKQERAAIEVGAMAHKGTAAYFVRDNGVGFDMAYAAKLFGAFQRLHAKEDYPGTGIGLATVQRIVARHGGRLWAEGQAGQGATFYFTLGERSAQ